MGLITGTQLKRRTSIGGNVDPDKYNHLIDDAEVFVLEPALGTKLYEKIVTDYNEGATNNLTGDYLELYNNYIVPILCYTTYAEYLKDGIILAQNTGIYENAPDNVSGADIENVNFVSKTNKSRADIYIERMKRYLCDKNLPEYINSQDDDFDIDPQDVTTLSGWYLPPTKGSKSGYGGSGSGGDFVELDGDGLLQQD